MSDDDSETPMVKDSKVLLVEDDLQLLELSTQILEFFGFTVHAFADGKEGLDWFKSHSNELDLIILDRRLPSIGGGALFRVMHHVNPQLPILLSTGDISTEDELQLLGEGITAVLRKPVPIKAFERAVRKAMQLPEEE